MLPVGQCVGRDDGPGHAPGAGTVAPRPEAPCLPLGRLLRQLPGLHLQPEPQKTMLTTYPTNTVVRP